MSFEVDLVTYSRVFCSFPVPMKNLNIVRLFFFKKESNKFEVLLHFKFFTIFKSDGICCLPISLANSQGKIIFRINILVDDSGAIVGVKRQVFEIKNARKLQNPFQVVVYDACLMNKDSFGEPVGGDLVRKLGVRYENS